ncbi:MAG: NACHT domain-containing protein, partial [Cyanobium sp.]
PRVRLIVTSRIVGYDPERLQNAGFRHFTLVDFNQAQIASFIRKWHALALMEEQERERTEISKRLSTAIQSSQAIRLLAGNPLLLTMMAILNRKQELPRRRASLYEESAKVLLHAWDIEYKKMALTLDEADLTAKQELLRSVAYNMQTQPRREGKPGGASKDTIRIHREELQGEIVAFMAGRNAAKPRRIAALLIEQLRKRDFMLCHVGNDYYAFVHRTFLEYFCASAIVMRFNKRGTEGGLELDQLKQDVFREHWRDQSWHEVMRLIIGHDLVAPAFAEDILLDLINQKTEDGNVAALILAADCYMEIEQKHKVEMCGDN